jgi:hypothetical protein
MRSIKQSYFQIRNKYNIVWTFKGISFAITGYFRKLPQNMDVLFLCQDVHRHSMKEGKKYSPLIDSLIDYFHDKNGKLRIATLATPFSKDFGRGCYSEVYNANNYVLYGIIKRFIKTGSFELLDPSNDPLVFEYERLLKRINCKIVIGIQPSVEFCLAASRLGIITCDLQHGLISDVNYYNINKRKKINHSGWPNFVLCWDMESVLRLNKFSNNAVSSFVIGNPSYLKESNICANKEYLNTVASKSDIKIQFLVTLTFHNYGFVFEDIYYNDIGVPQNLVQIMKSTPDIFWRIRLHPVQRRFHYKRIDKLLKSIFQDQQNVDWEFASNVNFIDAIRGCNGHLTVSSASALDASILGIKTLFVGSNDTVNYNKIYFFFQEHIDNGKMLYIENSHLSKENILSFFKSDNTKIEDEFISKYNSEGLDKFFDDFVCKLIAD